MKASASRVATLPVEPVASPRRRHESRLLSRRRQTRSKSNNQRDHAFVWTRFALSFVSYALLLTDVLRTGLGVKELPSGHVSVEPDSRLFVGPTAYILTHLNLTNATDSAAGIRYWPYKYDTTSIGMRSVATFFGLGAWSPCVLYREKCDESNGLSRPSVFGMIDSLVDAVSSHSGSGVDSPRGRLTLRIDSIFQDRLHHFVAPFFFRETVKRTIQATYYAWGHSHAVTKPLCGPRVSTRPFACSESWTRRLPSRCASLSPSCTDVRRVHQEIPRHILFLASHYPNSSIDSVIIDSSDDYYRRGLSHQGRRRTDVAMFSRVRSCDALGRCVTVAVDDFRVEASGFVINIRSWYGLVASLRALAQAYMWLRVALLVWVCHAASRDASLKYRKASRKLKCQLLFRTIFAIPSQVVLYGSIVPIALYALAHLIDSPGVYELLAIRFNTLGGSFQWSMADFVHHCAVSMRTVWTLSFMCHFVVMAATRCAWSPSRGVPGVPELSISLVAVTTIFAQYRNVAFRCTRVLRVMEVVPSAHLQQVRSYCHGRGRSAWTLLFFGSTVDWKCLSSALVVVVVVAAVLWVLHRLFPNRVPLRVSLTSRTIVPYSASFLWPRSRLVVSWFGSVVTVRAVKDKAAAHRKIHVAQLRSIAAVGLPIGKNPRAAVLRVVGDRGLVIRAAAASRQALCEIEHASSRSKEIETAIYLMNLAVMTDPLTLLRLRGLSGQLVALYESNVTHQRVLLPLGVSASGADIAIDWHELQLLAVVNTKALDWDELLRIG